MTQENIPNTSDLLEKLNQTQRELSVLYEVSKAMQSTLDLNQVLYIILTGVTSHTGLGFNRAVLFLANHQERCLEPKMAIGPESGEQAQKIWQYISQSNQDLDDLINENRITENTNASSLYESIKNFTIPLSPEKINLLSQAYFDGRTIHIPQEEIKNYSQDPLFQVFRTNELVIMPLKAKEKINGLIIADNLFTQKAITTEDLKIFEMLANQAGYAIENSQLYEMVMQKSHMDSLTNLWNHGFFQNQLSNELKKSTETQLPTSLIILDIDDFKKLNDTYGHQHGDTILKEIATILQDSSRGIDYVCRYGGEEFSIILTQTNKEQAYSIAERIRQNVEKHVFSRFSLFTRPSVTVSVGLATFPDDANKKEDLIKEADRAMYKAKFSGKNQTYAA